MRTPTAEDRRTALRAAITTTDKGTAIATDAHARHPHSQLWGDGTTASSDGQFFRASDRAAKRGDVNLHYGREPSSKFCGHLSDQYGYFGILPISPPEIEAVYVLDSLFDHDTIEIEEHNTDTGGASDHIFALSALIGKRFAPQLRNIRDRISTPSRRPMPIRL
ncbi:transposase [Rhizobium leguminosarum]|uniref:transposase n=1 Tax=Rhizobium leguminosarum TaxID=384 RepID=UPI0021BBB803|nr:transposase [Rhizobium leguminosarum]